MKGETARDFLGYMVANIDEDIPRLVFADWLQEQGQEDRAEFIRVQVDRARLPEWDPAQVHLRIREQQLLKRYGEEWLAELPTIEGARWEGFRRGIIAEVSFASYEAMRASAHACRTVAPVEAVTVRWPRRRETRAGGEQIAELRELNLTGRAGSEDEIRWLAESPQLATLRTLTARGLWADGLARLMASRHLANLKSLRLPGNDLGNAGIVAIVRAASLTALEQLDLSGRGVSERYNDDPIIRSPGMEALAAWSGLATVRSLTLTGNEMGRAGLRALLRSKHAGGLKHLTLRASRLDGQAVSEFDSAQKGLLLETLDLGENVLKDVGAEYVAVVSCLRELKMLKLDRCEVSLTGARLFAKKAKFLPGLRVLDVGHNHFGPSGLEALLDRQPEELHTLRMRDNDLLDEGAELLAKSPASDLLREVDVSGNMFGPVAAQALGETPHLRNLLALNVSDNPFGVPAAKELTDSPLGKRLLALELSNTGDADDIPF